MPVRLLSRLAGLETEYVARYRPDAPNARRPLTFQLLGELVAELKRRLPVVPADYPKKGFFLATGGAIWHERPGEGFDHPLIEGSTPECRGVRELLACQRAQDRLLAAAAQDVSGGEFTLSKSDCDADGNVYGSQENYEVELARGWRLFAWRVGVFLILVPLIALGWMLLMPIAMLLLVYFIAAGLLYLGLLELRALLRRVITLPEPKALRTALFGPEGGEALQFLPKWLALVITMGEHTVLAPAAIGLALWSDLFAFRNVRRRLLPFLISRTILAGNGRLRRDGRFAIASKASGMRLANGIGLFRVRSIFNFGPQFKALTFFSLVAGRKFPSLLAARQRLQICLGDGNLCDEAELLRIGTTMLLLDAIESGFDFRIPRLRRPMRALRQINSDPTLRAKVRITDGRDLSAIEIQRIYLHVCQAFVAQRDEASAEANEVLSRWEAALDDLEAAPNRLIGRLDWVTKAWLIEACSAADAPWEVRKKIDLRYHELSPDGYFERLRSAGIVKEILTQDEIERASAQPPADTPATVRGREIRRLSGSRDIVRANWQCVTVGKPAHTITWTHSGRRQSCRIERQTPPLINPNRLAR